MGNGKSVFITGTDTGAGKTYVSLALIRGWRARGLSVGVMKPCETGLRLPRGETGPPQDAATLLAASGADLTLEEVCPFRFDLPMAPAEAAALEGGEVSFEEIARVHRSIADRYDVTLVEGAGGLLVPFAGERTAADLARALRLPVIIAARVGLGTINHTWLTVEAARRRGLEVLGVVFTRPADPREHPPGPDEARNPAAVERLAQVRVLGNLAFAEEPPALYVPL